MTHTVKKRKLKRGQLNKKDRLELARARGKGKGFVASINEKGELESTTKEERAATNIKETVNREEALEKERKGRLGTEKVETTKINLGVVEDKELGKSGKGVGVAGALDIISAPLSQPGATLSGGIRAGAAAVRESRGKIAGGDSAEQAKVALTTILTTATLAAPFTVGLSAPIIKINKSKFRKLLEDLKDE